MKKIINKNEKGITLIALVITIIVLLILAGVAISMLSGENGIINKTNSAKTENETATVEEQVKLAVMAALASGNGKIEGDDAFSALNKGLKDAGYSEEDIIALPTIIEIGGNNYKIDKKGAVTKVKDVVQEQERTNIQTLIITGFVYKDIAATIPYKYLDMEKTALGIYNNLTGNGYKLTKADGNVVANSNGLLLEENGETIIVLNIEGSHGEYKGTVNNTGLKGDIEIVEPGIEEPPADPSTIFNWNTLGFMNIDTTTEYIDEYGSISLQFTLDGKLIVTGNVDPIVKLDVTTIDKSSEFLNFETKYYGALTGFNVKMNENGNDIKLEYYAIEGSENGTIDCKKVEIDNVNIYSNEKVLEALGITNYKGTYRGTWTKIGTDENGKTKLVSTCPIKEYMLGKEDPRATDSAVEGALQEGASDLEKAIWSYKNVKKSLNAVVSEATNGIIGARSIEKEDIEELLLSEIEKGDNYGKEYTYTYETSPNHIFVNKDGETVKIDSNEKSVTLENSAVMAGYLSNEEYNDLIKRCFWVASQDVRCNENGASFTVLDINSSSIGWIDCLFNSSGYPGDINVWPCGVMAVITVDF